MVHASVYMTHRLVYGMALSTPFPPRLEAGAQGRPSLAISEAACPLRCSAYGEQLERASLKLARAWALYGYRTFEEHDMSGNCRPGRALAHGDPAHRPRGPQGLDIYDERTTTPWFSHSRW